MDLVAVEAAATRPALSGKLPELRNAGFVVIRASELLQIFTDQLVEAGPERLRALSGARDQLLVQGQGYTHT